MDVFLQKHADKITGTISCPDRVLFKGHLSLTYPGAMERFMSSLGLLLKDFKTFGKQQSELLKVHAQQMCAAQGRPYQYLAGFERKEDIAQAIALRDEVSEGLVCVLATQETCSSFRLAFAPGRPRLESSKPRCLCVYYYFMDREFGLTHVRLQTWFPFTIQVCLNGHAWLARKLDRCSIAYTMQDNAFVHIDNLKRAQRLADKFVRRPWPKLLDRFAKRVNPLLKDMLAGRPYYWVTDQFEYATDVMFKDQDTLKELYKELLEHASLCLGAEDIFGFLGRKLTGNFQGEAVNERKKRIPGTRVKHRVKKNWIKMYDKFGSVLRIETVINHPYDFRVRREGKRNGETVVGWFPMAKGVANLYRYAEICLSANRRYLQALSVVDDPSEALTELVSLAVPVRKNGRSHRGFNPLRQDDARLFAAVLRGEHALMGFRNKDIRVLVLGDAKNRKTRQRLAARVSRLLKLLHLHALIAKIPRSHRWRVTRRGQKLMSAAIILARKTSPRQYDACAA